MAKIGNIECVTRYCLFKWNEVNEVTWNEVNNSRTKKIGNVLEEFCGIETFKLICKRWCAKRQMQIEEWDLNERKISKAFKI